MIVVLGTVISGVLLLFLIRTFKNTKRMQELIREEEAGLEELPNSLKRIVHQADKGRDY